MEIRGSAPWFSLEASADEIVIIAHLPIPTENEVCRCMNCPYSECKNCMGSGKEKLSGNTNGRPNVYDVNTITSLVKSGRSSREISRAVGCTERTARLYISKFKKAV